MPRFTSARSPSRGVNQAVVSDLQEQIAERKRYRCFNSCCLWCGASLLGLLNAVELIIGAVMIVYGVYYEANRFAPMWIYATMTAFGAGLISISVVSACSLQLSEFCICCCSCVLQLSGYLAPLLSISELAFGTILLTEKSNLKHWRQDELKNTTSKLAHFSLLTSGILGGTLIVLAMLALCRFKLTFRVAKLKRESLNYRLLVQRADDMEEGRGTDGGTPSRRDSIRTKYTNMRNKYRRAGWVPPAQRIANMEAKNKNSKTSEAFSSSPFATCVLKGAMKVQASSSNGHEAGEREHEWVNVNNDGSEQENQDQVAEGEKEKETTYNTFVIQVHDNISAHSWEVRVWSRQNCSCVLLFSFFPSCCLLVFMLTLFHNQSDVQTLLGVRRHVEARFSAQGVQKEGQIYRTSQEVSTTSASLYFFSLSLLAFLLKLPHDSLHFIHLKVHIWQRTSLNGPA